MNCECSLSSKSPCFEISHSSLVNIFYIIFYFYEIQMIETQIYQWIPLPFKFKITSGSPVKRLVVFANK